MLLTKNNFSLLLFFIFFSPLLTAQERVDEQRINLIDWQQQIKETFYVYSHSYPDFSAISPKLVSNGLGYILYKYDAENLQKSDWQLNLSNISRLEFLSESEHDVLSQMKIAELPVGNYAVVSNALDENLLFYWQESAWYEFNNEYGGRELKRVENDKGEIHWELHLSQTETYIFNEAGQQIQYLNSGRTPNLTYQYNELNQLIRIVNEKDERYKFFYNDSEQLVKIVEMKSGKKIIHEYDAQQRLTSVLFVEGALRNFNGHAKEKYFYQDESHPELLTKIISADNEVIFQARVNKDGYIETRDTRFVHAEISPSENFTVENWSNNWKSVIDSTNNLFYVQKNDNTYVVTLNTLFAEQELLKNAWHYPIERTKFEANHSCDDCVIKSRTQRSAFGNLVMSAKEWKSGKVEIDTYEYESLKDNEPLYSEKNITIDNQFVERTRWLGDSRTGKLLEKQTPGSLETITYENDYPVQVRKIDTSVENSKALIKKFHYENDLLIFEDGPRTDVEDKTTHEYDLVGNLIKTTNALNQSTQYEYDDKGRVLAAIDPNGMRSRMSYNSSNLVTQHTTAVDTPLEATTHFGYDELNRLFSVEYPDGRFYSRQFNEKGQVISVKDRDNNSISYHYDAEGNQILTSNNQDEVNKLLQIQKVVFDNSQRHIEINETKVTYQYTDQQTNPNKVILPNGSSHQTFNAQNQLVATKDNMGQVTQFIYDEQGQVYQVIDPRGVVTEYHYDGFERLIHSISPSTGSTRYQYDNAGNVTQEIKENGIIIKRRFDALNRMIEEVYTQNGGHKKHRSYVYDDCKNGVGKLCRVTGNGSETRYEYDIAGNFSRVQTHFEGETHTTDFSYLPGGQLARITYPSGLVVNYSHDDKGQVKQVTATRDKKTFNVVSDLNYQGFEQKLTSLTWGNGLSTTYQYDENNRIKQLTTEDTQKTVQSLAYRYDELGNITMIERFLRPELSQEFFYDGLNRITEEKQRNTSTKYEYDAAGNRLTLSRQDEKFTKLKTYSYDKNANHLIKINNQALNYDSNGNLIEDRKGKRHFKYDVTNRLTAFYKNNKKYASYTYNHKNQRIKKTLHKQDNENLDYRSLYFSYLPNGWLQTETVKGLNNQKKLHRDIIWLSGKPIAQIETKFKDSGDVRWQRILYLHTDHLNTPRLATNQVKEVVWRWDSDAFGVGKAERDPDQNGQKTRVRLRFPGQYYDHESGLYYNHNRDYDPSIGRYIQSDPIGILLNQSQATKQLNKYNNIDLFRNQLNHLYGYSDQNPVNLFDPSGEWVIVIPIIEFGITVTGADIIIGGLIASVLSIRGDSATVYMHPTGDSLKDRCIEMCLYWLPDPDFQSMNFQRCIRDCMDNNGEELSFRVPRMDPEYEAFCYK